MLYVNFSMYVQFIKKVKHNSVIVIITALSSIWHWLIDEISVTSCINTVMSAVKQSLGIP